MHTLWMLLFCSLVEKTPEKTQTRFLWKDFAFLLWFTLLYNRCIGFYIMLFLTVLLLSSAVLCASGTSAFFMNSAFILLKRENLMENKVREV